MKNENDSFENTFKEELSSNTKKVIKVLVPSKLPTSDANKLNRNKTVPIKVDKNTKLFFDSGDKNESLLKQHETSEGNYIFFLTNKSSSETSLQESEKPETESTNSISKSEIRVDNPEFYINSEPKISILERTKALENFYKMPAFGELMLDSSTLSANPNTNKPKDHLYKILVIGDLGTGKTSIIKRYVHRFFTQHYRATIGVDFALKVLNWDENTLIRLQLWDIAGQERYGNMTRVYYKEAVGAFIVFDVTRRNTFESVINWKSDLDSKVQLPDGSSIPCVLLANKCDQQKEGLVTNPTKMDEYCKDNGFVTWFETSARDNINIDDAARSLVEQVLEKDSIINNDRNKGDQFAVAADSTSGRSRNKCSC